MRTSNSEHPTSKVKGGDVGRQSLMSETLPRTVLDAAYHLDPFIVSEPVFGPAIVRNRPLEPPLTHPLPEIRHKLGKPFPAA